MAIVNIDKLLSTIAKAIVDDRISDSIRVRARDAT